MGEKYDIAILGSGPGGYIAAERAAQLGAKVCVVEKEALGGTCLNTGCIPTKTLVASVGVLSVIEKAEEFGITVNGHSVSLPKMIERKNNVITKLRSGIEGLFKTNKIELIQGVGKLTSNETIDVDGKEISAKNIIIAVGSRPFELPNIKFNKDRIISSTEILDLQEAPESLLIIGGGVIGCEMATIWNALGTKVTIVEMMPQLLPLEDKEPAKKLESVLKRKGVQILTKTKVETIEEEGNLLKVNLSGGKIDTVVAQKILVSVGRKINSDNIGLEEVGVDTERGKIIVDQKLKTSVDNIYAIGDCIGGYMLAHAASYEGILAVENILTDKTKNVDYKAVPSCIFTHPEIASVGLTKTQAVEKGFEVKEGKFSFLALGRAHTCGATDGFVKLIADAKTHKLLGAQIMGYGATDLIAEIALSISADLTVDKIVDTIHAHPTFAEAIYEAACYIVHK